MGSIELPGKCFSGRLPVRWGIWGEDWSRPDERIVYFTGQSAETTVGLGGSPRHLIGPPRNEPVLDSMGGKSNLLRILSALSSDPERRNPLAVAFVQRLYGARVPIIADHSPARRRCLLRPDHHSRSWVSAGADIRAGGGSPHRAVAPQPRGAALPGPLTAKSGPLMEVVYACSGTAVIVIMDR